MTLEDKNVTAFEHVIEMFRFAIEKIFSAKFLMSLMFSATACWAMIHKELSVEAFMALAGTAVSGYFSNSEKKMEPKNGNGNGAPSVA